MGKLLQRRRAAVLVLLLGMQLYLMLSAAVSLVECYACASIRSFRRVVHLDLVAPPPRGDMPSRLVAPLGSTSAQKDDVDSKPDVWDHRDCQLSAEWQTKSYPNCNVMHEHPLDDSASHFRGQGGLRSAFRYETLQGPTVVLRTPRHDEDFYSFREQVPRDFLYERHRIDAMVMERLTSSPHVISNYAYCGVSLMTEMGKGTLRELWVEGASDATEMELLKVGLEVARGLAALHTIDDGEPTVAHHDFNGDNVLVMDDGRIVLNDFNQAVLIPSHGAERCKRFNQPHHLRFGRSSPRERFQESPVALDKIDTWALGIVLFGLLIRRRKFQFDGLPVTRTDEDLAQHVRVPMLSPGLLHSEQLATQALLYAALACMADNPEDRPPVSRIAKGLETALEWLDKGTGDISSVPDLFLDDHDNFAQAKAITS